MIDEQIVRLYEDEGVDIETLSKTFNIDEESIRLSLLNKSIKFRKNKDETFDDEIYNNAKLVMSQLLFAENESVKYRTSKFIINEKLGRNENKHIGKDFKNITINVLQINEQLKKAKDAKKRAKQLIEV